jgi:hypothetical protein
MLLLSIGQLCVAFGCSVDVRDGVGPRNPVPNVHGIVLRNSHPAGNLIVELRTIEDAITLAETSTNSEGVFAFADVAAGRWEVKVNGDIDGDFDSISRAFLLEDSMAGAVLEPVDIFSFGAGVLEPADSVSMAAPNPFSTIGFSWKNPDKTLLWARVQLYNSDGAPVWYSSKEPVEQAEWNGLGNRGEYTGELMGAGQYSWRIKYAYSESLEARSDPRDLTLQ